MTEMKNIIDWFRASATYINAHRGKVFVIMLSGEAMADPNLPNIVYDLSLLRSFGVKLVIVHGSRPQISSALEQRGLKNSYHNNVRITEANSIHCIKETVSGLSVELESMFTMGMSNSPLHGADIRLCRGNFVTAKPQGIHDGVDFHYTGRVRKIHADAIQQQLAHNNIVLLSNLGYSLTGEVFNLTAEEVATEAAIALQAEKLILFIPENGVHDDDGDLVASLDGKSAELYARQLSSRSDQDSVCTAQALQAALRAYTNSVRRIHLVGYKENGALLQELYTREGQGSLLSSDSFDLLRPASIEDIAAILNLIRPLETEGTLVERSRELLENEINNFQVIELEGTVIACAALYPIESDSAELACIAIHPHYQKHGYGKRLLENIEKQAARQGFSKLFVLTTVTDHWFKEHGFESIDLSELPLQKQQLYNYQRKSKVLRKLLG